MQTGNTRPKTLGNRSITNLKLPCTSHRLAGGPSCCPQHTARLTSLLVPNSTFYITVMNLLFQGTKASRANSMTATKCMTTNWSWMIASFSFQCLVSETEGKTGLTKTGKKKKEKNQGKKCLCSTQNQYNFVSNYRREFPVASGKYLNEIYAFSRVSKWNKYIYTAEIYSALLCYKHLIFKKSWAWFKFTFPELVWNFGCLI